MSYFDDNEDRLIYGRRGPFHGDTDDDPRDVTCRRCNATGLHWQMVTQPDGRSERPVLFNEKGRRHVCTPSSDDFEVLT